VAPLEQKSPGSVRMGPISIFSLVILLSLAVLSVLAFSTAQAQSASAEKHAQFTTDTYVNESAAQEMLAAIDATLLDVRGQGGSAQDALAALPAKLPKEARVEGNEVKAVFQQASGRLLSVTIEITDTVEYRIVQWQATTKWDMTKDKDVLWTG